MELISLNKMAERFGVTAKTFARRVRADNIPYTPFGRSMRFDPVEVVAYLRALRVADKPVVVKYQPRKVNNKRHRLAEALGL